ncbi:MAG: hypothetical protein WKF58_15860 [Ilumatobacteraceae bacterium]
MTEVTVSEVKSRCVRAALDGLCAQYGEEHVRGLPDGQGRSMGRDRRSPELGGAAASRSPHR